MEMTSVKSSNIKAVGHSKKTNTLHVEFKGGKTFAYDGVLSKEYSEMMRAKSIGSHFIYNIKKRIIGVEVVKSPEIKCEGCGDCNKVGS